MGMLTSEVVKCLQCVSKYGIKGKSLAMIGKQDIHINWEDFYGIIKELDIEFDADMAKRIKGQKNIDSFDFFRGLGFAEVHALDYSDYEGADIIFDLNTDLPENMKGSFDYVINGGTIEHVFDIAKAMDNISGMVKDGGIIMHYSPTAGWIDHGFYSLSPTFFQDFYKCNEFSILQLELEFIMSKSVTRMDNIRCFYSEDLRLFKTSYEINNYIESIKNNSEVDKIMTICFAKRNNSKTTTKYPIQGYYNTIYGKDEHNTIYVRDIEFEKMAQEIVNSNATNIAIFGAGNICNLLLSELFKKDAANRIKLIFDNNADKAGTYLRGVLVAYPTEKKLQEMNQIYICNAKYENEIAEQLRVNGIQENVIRKSSEFLQKTK